MMNMRISRRTYYDMPKFVYWDAKEKEHIRSYLKSENPESLRQIMQCHARKLNYVKSDCEDLLLMLLIKRCVAE